MKVHWKVLVGSTTQSFFFLLMMSSAMLVDYIYMGSVMHWTVSQQSERKSMGVKVAHSPYFWKVLPFLLTSHHPAHTTRGLTWFWFDHYSLWWAGENQPTFKFTHFSAIYWAEPAFEETEGRLWWKPGNSQIKSTKFPKGNCDTFWCSIKWVGTDEDFTALPSGADYITFVFVCLFGVHFFCTDSSTSV